jgi:hypothetical protein
VLAALSSAEITDHREARHLLCLAYVALVAARLCSTLAKVIARRAVVAAGYEEGDFVALGVLERDGSFAAPKPEPAARAAKLPRLGVLFQVVDLGGKGGAWLLDSPQSPGRALPLNFGRAGKRIKPQPLRVTVYKKGKPVDLSFTLTRVMVANRRVGELMATLDPRSIQRVPVGIEETEESFEIINILNLVPSKQLLAWSKKNGKPVSEAPLEKAHIALTGPTSAVVVISRKLAEALAAAGATGTELVPLDKSKL